MKKLFTLGIVVSMALIFSLYIYAQREKMIIASSVLRLHVVAQSNGKNDQELKLKVRDAVLREAKALLSAAENKEEAKTIVKENENLFVSVAEKTLREEGCNYPVTVNVGKTSFPLKIYENIRLPGGVYDAVNIKIGEAKGENWWCIMYPMLCFTDNVTAKLDKDGENVLKEELGEERFSLITETKDKKINIKFKILELF